MMEPSLVIEDFAYFLERWPGAMVYLGAGLPWHTAFNTPTTPTSTKRCSPGAALYQHGRWRVLRSYSKLRRQLGSLHSRTQSGGFIGVADRVHQVNVGGESGTKDATKYITGSTGIDGAHRPGWHHNPSTVRRVDRGPGCAQGDD